MPGQPPQSESDSDHPGVAVIRAEKAWMRGRFTELVAEAGIGDAERVARIVHLLCEGALVASDVGNDSDAVAAAPRGHQSTAHKREGGSLNPAVTLADICVTTAALGPAS